MTTDPDFRANSPYLQFVESNGSFFASLYSGSNDSGLPVIQTSSNGLSTIVMTVPQWRVFIAAVQEQAERMDEGAAKAA